MKLGIGSYTFPWAVGVPGRMTDQPLTCRALLEEAARLGVSVIQICDNMPFAGLPAREIESFADAAAAAEIEVELGTRGLDPDGLLHHLALVKQFGGSFLRLVIDKGDDEPTAEDAVRRLGQVAPQFRDAGVRIGIENHDRFSARSLAEMVEMLGTDVAGITLDTVNSFGAEEGPDVTVPMLAPFTVCLHVKDYAIRRPDHQMGFLVEGCAAGAGRLDIPKLISDVQRLSPHPCHAILEHWITPSDSLAETIARERAAAEEGIALLRQLLG